MAARVCPQCSQVVPATLSVAFSNGMECPNCHTRLEVAEGTRTISSAAGLLAGWIVWHFTRGSNGVLGFVLPELYAIITFGIVSPLILMFTAGLRPAPAAPAPVPVASHGHGGGHH